MAIIWKSNDNYSVQGVKYRIEIDDAQFTGTYSSSNVFVTSNVNVKFEGDGDNLFNSTIHGSSIEIKIDNNDQYSNQAALESFLQSIIYYDEQRLTIILYKNDVLEGVYPVLQDLCLFDDASPYTFTLKGTDGLAILKDIDFNPGIFNTDMVLLGDIIRQCLSNTGVDLFYKANDPYILSTIFWYEISQVKTSCPLANSRINVNALYEDPEKFTYKNCYDVIVAILQPFGARLIMTMGAWYIHQPDIYLSTYTTFTIHRYGNRVFSNAELSHYDFTPKLTEGTIANCKRTSGNNGTMKPGLQYVKVNYAAKSLYIFRKTSYDVYPVTNEIIDVNNFSILQLLLKIHITYEIIEETTHLGTSQSGFARLEFTITASTSTTTYWLSIDPNDTSKAAEWVTTPNQNSGLPTSFWYDFPKITDSRPTNTVDLQLTIPPVPDSSITQIDFNTIRCHEIDSMCGSDIKWSADFTLSQLTSSGTDTDDIQFTSTNPTYPAPKQCDSVNVGTNIITLAAHGYYEGAQLRILNPGTTGLTQGALLFAKNVTTNTFQLALISGGAPIALGGTASIAPEVQLYTPASARLASQKLELENLIGDSHLAFVMSAIEIWTGSVWQRSQAWNIGTAAVSGYSLGQLLAMRALLLQKTPRMVYQGTMIHTGLLTPAIAPYFWSRIFLFNAGTWDFDDGTVQSAEWYEIALSSDDTVPTTGTPNRPPGPVDAATIGSLIGQVSDLNAGWGDIVSHIQGFTRQIGQLRDGVGNSQPNLTLYTPGLPDSPGDGDSHNLMLKYNAATGRWEVTV
jgi:hypothetical protein